MEKGLEANSLESRYSLLRCGPSSISIPWKLVRNAISQLNWNLLFTRVPTGLMRTLNFGKIWSRSLVSQNGLAPESPLELIKNYRILVPAPWDIDSLGLGASAAQPDVGTTGSPVVGKGMFKEVNHC